MHTEKSKIKSVRFFGARKTGAQPDDSEGFPGSTACSPASEGLCVGHVPCTM